MCSHQRLPSHACHLHAPRRRCAGYVSRKPTQPRRAVCCTCKGFRVSCNCSHTVAVTAMYLKEEHCVPGRRPFDAAFLEALLEKLPTTRRRSHRPLGIRPGNRFQPTTDLVDEDTPEEEEGEEEEEESEEGEELTEEWERYGCGDKRRRKTVP